MKPIIINLWFKDEAEQAARYYTLIFPNSSVDNIAYYPDAGQEVTGQAAGAVMTVSFTINGQGFIGLNGGDAGFHFDESISFVVNCDSQDEIDKYWDSLTADGGEASQCGWLKDKYGVSWQIVTSRLDELLSSSDKDVSERVMTAMLKMQKISIPELEAAANGE